MITKKEVIENKDLLFQYLAQSNDWSYNIDKAIEESLEFGECLVKIKTKNRNNPKRPDLNEAIKEYGDVMMRGLIALITLFPNHSPEDLTEEVFTHIDKKISNLYNHMINNDYELGL